MKNTGKVAGKESVLRSAAIPSLEKFDGRRLRAFDKVELQPGETKTMTFELKADDLLRRLEWQMEIGEGDFADDCRPEC